MRPSQTAVEEIFKQAAGMDSTVRVPRSLLPELSRRFVPTSPYTRDKMFNNMATRRVSIFRDVPVLVRRRSSQPSEREALVSALSKLFPRSERARVQVGPTHRVTRLPVREVMRRWSGGRAIVGVTDLHIRGTRVEEVIDTKVLSDFNIIIRGSEALSLQEMMTLVIASRGNVTDSHSDDPDGTNHCFFGKKLWLAWDTFDGMRSGLQDVERQDVYGQATFSMRRFLSLKSACWFLVSDGDTLYLPGGLTHKVFTLEPYLGVGSFHMGLPSCLDSLTRWIVHGSLWSINDQKKECVGLLDDALGAAIRVARRAKAGGPTVRRRWGYDHLRKSYSVWKQALSQSEQKRVGAHPRMTEFIELARSA